MTEGAPAARPRFPLFLDEPASVDLLSFDAVAGTVVDALTDDTLDPIALGLSGAWGSGKTSVLRLIAAQLATTAGSTADRIVVETDPWRYDPQLGAKESLIGEVLAALATEIPETDAGANAKALLTRLTKRIDWGKALRVAANSAITVSLPSIDDIASLVKPKEEKNEPEPITDMTAFRVEFERLLGMEGLDHLKGIVVLVDDLDRCLPDTVVETLETIRLFLSVPKMSFVIAADEARVAEAIATHFPQQERGLQIGEETPAQLYLHKIVQTSVPVPALSDFDTEAYLVLLQVQSLMSPTDYAAAVAAVALARKDATPLESVTILTGAAFSDARNNAARIKPIVHEKTLGNPRRIKRFVNDVSVRLSIATRRGITLDAATIAKLMVLEQYFPDDFKTVTGWLRENSLRLNMAALERQAGTFDESAPEPSVPTAADPAVEAAAVPTEKAPRRGAVKVAEVKKAAAPEAPNYSEGLVRWARLSPSLATEDLSSYLVFAASFQRILLTAQGLSERVRDLATSLLSRSVTDNRSVTDEMLISLKLDDVQELIRHIAGVIVDQPPRQTAGVTALIRLARRRADTVGAVVAAIHRIPPNELKAGGLINLDPTDPAEVLDAFSELAAASGNEDVKNAMDLARNG